MTNYAQAGRAREHRVRHDLEAFGYEIVRSAGSKGAIDLVAIEHLPAVPPGRILFIQVKTTTAPGPVPWNKLYDLATSVGAVPVLATVPQRKAIRYELLTDRKERRGRNPLAPFDPTITPGEMPCT